jgi:DNA-binding CsgD family transcriptional regulator
MSAGPARARVVRRVVRARGFAIGFATTEALLRSALADASSDVPTRALLEHDLGLALLQYGHLEDAVSPCEAAVELAAKTGDALLAQRAEITRDVLRFMQGHGAPLDLDDRAHGLLAEESRERRSIEPAFLDEALACALMLKSADRFESARELLEQLLRNVEAERGEGIVAPVLFHLVELECWAGRLDRSTELVRELQRALARVKHGGMRTRVGYAAALINAHRGALDRARRIAATHLTGAVAEGDFFLAIRLEALLGFIALSGNTPIAADHLQHASALSESAGYGEPGIVRFAGDEIEALLRADQIDAAELSLERLEQRARHLDRLWAYAVAGHGRAQLTAAHGDLDGALELAHATLPFHDRLTQPLERGRLFMTVGILHRRLKNRVAARERLAAAHATFEAIGATAWAARATAETERISGRRQQQSRLTPTEQRAAELAAAGRTNKEVAAELHLSVKTVEANLSRVYRKLAIRGRSELAARLRIGDEIPG